MFLKLKNMIQQKTVLQVLDNSGAKTVKCLKVLKKIKKKYATIGDFIIVTVQKLRNKSKKDSKVKKKDILKALIVKTKAKISINTGFKNLFTENAVILINKQERPIASRILTFLPAHLNKKKFQKIINISLGLI